MTAPKVSVVVPAYNNEPFIRQTMRSVLDQADVDLELVVADHTSSDGTWDAMAEFADDPRVRLHTTPAGGGAESNFNRVSAEATGEYVKLLPGDDYLLPGMLARQVAILDSNPGAMLTACKRVLVDARGADLLRDYGLKGVRGPLSGPDAIRSTVRAGSNIFGEPGSVLMRRSALEAAGYWDFSHPYLVDEATYVNVLMTGSFVPEFRSGAAFRLNNGQWSVALTGYQYEQVSGFHRALHARRPDLVSEADVRVGNRRAWLMAQRRRVSYRILKKRMS
ncbi:glycosyltransferase family 2 protein [Microbacterium sp. CFH 90308]|uniref:Glycosyltransferase family 2 protein n=1 Tax=Microbacterium salsuginis TaxID=2722803 RepID=A0ABX1KBN8_9MICO|nr:glycosyltransferase family 2 protein [Microbacterium sp. CFH 90308]